MFLSLAHLLGLFFFLAIPVDLPSLLLEMVMGPGHCPVPFHYDSSFGRSRWTLSLDLPLIIEWSKGHKSAGVPLFQFSLEPFPSAASAEGPFLVDAVTNSLVLPLLVIVIYCFCRSYPVFAWSWAVVIVTVIVV